MDRVTKHRLFTSTATMSVLLIGMAAATPASAVDQDSAAANTQPSNESGTAPSNANDGRLNTGDIIVTARKRAESALSVPISITAFTGDDLEVRNIKTTTDLANFTPSLTADTASAGGARVDRSTQLFVIRGMNPSVNINPTTSVFINGTPVGASDQVQNLDDLDHVEVLKGPQSAYFGRETFAGAINVVTRAAGDKLSADFSGEGATRGTYRASGSITIPIIDDALSIRVGGLYDKRDGSYRNAFDPSHRLGDQETKGGHLAITVKPTDNLTIKIFGSSFADDDGPAATGLLLGSGFNLPAAFNQSNCTINNTDYFCGTLPGLTSVSPAQVTTITAGQKAFFDNPGGIISKSDLIHHFGLKRQADHVDASVDWKIADTGLTASYLAGANKNNYSSISDLANIDGAAGGQYPGYTGFPFLVETRNHDYSQEGRLASDPTKRFRVLVGASYVNVYHESVQYGLFGSPGPAPLGSPSISRTTGAFFSVGFDITPKLTLTAEGRYQWDKEIAETPARAVSASGTSRNFLPRATLQYTLQPGLLAYATYSRGVNPSVFNVQFNSIPSQSQAELTSAGAAGGLAVKPELLDNYEVGVKGRFLDGRLTLALSGYYDKWKDQINTNVYTFAINDPANPYNIVGFSQYRPNNNSIYIYTFNDNSAASTAKGVELEATIIPVRHITVNLSGSYNSTRYDHFNCTSCAPYPTSGTGYNAAGNYLANAPRFSSAVGVQFDHETTLFGAKSFFVRADYFYHDGLYIQASNTVKTPSSNIVNFRAGLDYTHFSIEGFVNNAFNERAYTTGFQNYNFAGFFTPAVMVGLPTLITAGGRIRVKF